MDASIAGGAVLLAMLLIIVLAGRPVAPVATTRVAPTAQMLEKGYRTLVTLGLDPNIELFEKTVKPSGMDAGTKVDTTTQWNETVMTAAAPALYDTTDLTMTCAYDPLVRDSIRAAIGKHDTITTLYPNGGKEAAFGFLRTAEFSDQQRTAQPEVTITISFTNRDPAGAEEEAVYTPPPPPPP